MDTSKKNKLMEIYQRSCIHAQEETRVINVLENADSILSKIENIFEEKTSLGKTDQRILFLATALQLTKTYLLFPKIMERLSNESRLKHNDPSIMLKEDQEIAKFKAKHLDSWQSNVSRKGYKTWKEIAFTRKVPYDKIKHAGRHNITMHGGLHRVKTLGHDPVLGWIFGVANIITDTISVCPEYSIGEKKLPLPWIQSFTIDRGCWNNEISTTKVFSNAMESIMEDWHRLPAAIFAQGLHLTSDKNTKYGLPIPFLSLLNPDKAFKIYQDRYDYLNFENDLKEISASAALSILINKIISGIHCFFYNQDKEPNQKLYAVKTRKILLYSNALATTSDVIQTAMRTCYGDKSALKNFDVGGFLVTIHRVFSDIKFISEIKQEFISRELDRIIDSKDNILHV